MVSLAIRSFDIYSFYYEQTKNRLFLFDNAVLLANIRYRYVSSYWTSNLEFADKKQNLTRK